MTEQEIFDTVATHLLEQGHQARIGNCCMYRMPNGDKCAAGFLIPDECYLPGMERTAICAVIESYDLPSWFAKNKSLIASLQYVHDSDANLASFVTRDFDRTRLIANLRHVAICYRLDTRVLDLEEPEPKPEPKFATRVAEFA